MSRAGRARRVGRAASVLLGLVLGAATGVLGASPAQAHAVLESSAPRDGERLTTAPTQVRLTFDETVRPVADGTVVLADDGRHVDQGYHLEQDGKALVVDLEPGLPDGGYTAGYRVVSGDGHVVSGAIRFGINADAGATATAPAQPTSLDTVHDATQGAVYLGLALLVGVTAVGVLLWPRAAGLRRARVLWWVGWWVLLAGTVLRLATAGPVADGTGWDGVVRLSGLGDALTETGGVAGLIRIAGLALIALLVPVRAGVGRVVALATTVALLVTVALDGHAAAGDDAAAAIVASTIHLGAMSVWLGGLAVLCLVVLAPDSTLPPQLRRWSFSAYLAVALLVLSGEYQGWRQVQPLDALTTTDYGRLLLIKLALVAGALGLAVLARRFLVPAEASRRRLRTVVAAEAVVAATVVGLTTALVATPPARTTYGPPVTMTAPLATGTAEIRVAPTHTGVQTVVVRTLGANAAPVPATSVTATLGSDEVAGVAVPLEPQVDGTWTGRAVVPVAGTWTLTLTVRLPGGTFVTAASYRTW